MTNIIGEMELKRSTWTYKETMDLLNFCLAREIGKLMAQGKCNKKLLYQEMFNEMVRLGYEKTLEQVIIKFKNLYQKYRKGLPNNPSMQMNKKRFELWTLMHEVFKYGPLGRPGAKSEKDRETTPVKNLMKEQNLVEILDEPKKDPLSCDTNDCSFDINESKYPKEEVEQNILQVKKESDLQEPAHVKYFHRPSTKTDRSTANYLRCVRYLVEKFKTAQEELQNKFYIQQLKLQQQQQEWEERILDEEREFFVKILKQSEANARKKGTTNDIKLDEDIIG